jgi:hypothetical protein
MAPGEPAEADNTFLAGIFNSHRCSFLPCLAKKNVCGAGASIELFTVHTHSIPISDPRQVTKGMMTMT